MQKRAQAATEFLITYGWAILILILAVTALAGLNIFNIITPNVCTVSAPFSCKDSVFREGGFEIRLNNNGAAKAQIVENKTKIKNSICEYVSVSGNSINDLNLKAGDNIIRCYSNSTNLNIKENVNAESQISYVSQGSINHNINININGRVERSSYASNFDINKRLSLNFDDVNNNDILDMSYFSNNGISNTQLDCSRNGKSGLSCHFDRTQYIQFQNGMNIGDESFSIELWARPVDNLYNNPIYYQEYSITSTSTISLYIESTGLFFTLKNNLGDKTYSLNTVNKFFIGPGEWHHIAVVKENLINPNNFNMIIYIDGEKIDELNVNDNLNLNGNIWSIGKRNFPENYFNGLIDEFAFYNKALTQEEIKKHYSETNN